ncbi:unnamed protein product [Effrenium voratum]|nr:unnamed protein product [Effrenium voratum]
MAASWLKRRKELAYLIDPEATDRSLQQVEATRRSLRKGLSRISALRDEVWEISQGADESDLEFLQPTVGGTPLSDGPGQDESPAGCLEDRFGEDNGSFQGGLASMSHSDSTPVSPMHTTTSRASVGNLQGFLKSPKKRISMDLSACVPDTDGEVIDFIERRRVLATKTFVVKLWQRGILTGDIVAPARAELQLITQVLRADDPEETQAVSDCRFLIQVEELAAVIAMTVTRESKTTGRWPPTPAGRFKEWAKYLMSVERCCHETERQVLSWIVRFRLLHTGELPETPRDDSFDHRVRVAEFWHEYHKEAWNTKHPGLKRSNSSVSVAKAQAQKTSVPLTRRLSRELSLRKLMTKSSTSLLKDAGTGKVCKLPPVNNVTRAHYLRQCNGLTMTPLPIPFVIGESQDLQLAHLDLSDMELLAVAETLPTVEAVKKVDLHGNALLSDKALGQLLRRLLQPKLAATLVELSFGGCTKAGGACVDGVIQLVSDAFNLRRLDLSHVKIEHRNLLPLCEAISERQTLCYANLSGTSFGKGPMAFGCQCVTTLLQGHVAELDLSWNHFSSELFRCLGEQLAKRKMVRKLNVCNCSGTGIDALSTPINFYLEQLQMDTALTHLDISMSRMDFRSALILEDALENHKKLKHLSLGDNPLGPRGLRSVLRAAASEKNALTFFDTFGSYGGEEPSPLDNEVFSMSNLPGAGSYTLQLHRPYHRSLLRMLYKAAERFRLSPSEALTVLSEEHFSHGGKKKDGAWDVPQEGEVTLAFNLDRCLESSAFKDVNHDFDAFLKRFQDLTLHRLDGRKAVPVVGRWKDLEGFHHSQTVLLKALSFDFALSLSDFKVLAATSPLYKPKVIASLLPSVKRDPGWYFIAQGMYTTTSECVSSRMHLKQLLDFSAANPTGHYKLDLENRADFAVAEQLKLLDRWEVLLDKQRDRFDISATRNRSHARNVYYQGKSVQTLVPAFADWKLPTHDHLELDYASCQGPPKGAKAISWTSFHAILQAVHNPACSDQVKVEALKRQAPSLYVTSRQLRELIGGFGSSAHRIELCVSFFNRILDPENSKLYTGRLHFGDLLAFRRRIGFARTFPYIQIEFEQFQLNLSFHDERVCISSLLAISTREDAGNIRNPVYILPDGTMDPLKMGIPRSWEMLDRVPQGGTFKCTYVCSPLQRNYEFRRQLCQTYHFSEVRVPEAEVNWWTNCSEVPSEVIDLVLMLKDKGMDLSKAFDAIDGFDGNGEIGYGKLQQGLEELGWRKFKRSADHEIKEQFLAIFRCLNPSGHGTLARGDWNILQQVKQDVEQSLIECVQYLLRVSDHSWTTAWSKLDLECEDQLDRSTWQAALTRLGWVQLRQKNVSMALALALTGDIASVHRDIGSFVH